VAPSLTHPPLTRQASDRIVAIDAGRLVATFAIVWVHVSEAQGLAPRLSALGRFGTSFYIVSAVMMTALPSFRPVPKPAQQVIRARAKRLLVPFLLWSAIYAAFYLGTMVPQGYSIDQVISLWGPLAGTAPHLWFLPFAFLSSALTAVLMPHLLALSERTLWRAFVVCVLASYALSYALLPTLDQEGLRRIGLVRLARYVEEAPLALSAMLGVALYGKTRRKLGRLGRRRRLRIAGLLGAAFVVTQIAYFFALEPLRVLVWTEVRIFANVLGALWLGLCLALRNSAAIGLLSQFGRATYFAFLVHQLLLDLVKVPLESLVGHGHVGPALAATIGIFSVALVMGVWVPTVRVLRPLVP
jgi:hypothetical protein